MHPLLNIGTWEPRIGSLLSFLECIFRGGRENQRPPPPALAKIYDRASYAGLSSPPGNRAHLPLRHLLHPAKAQIACLRTCQTPWGCCSAPKSPSFASPSDSRRFSLSSRACAPEGTLRFASVLIARSGGASPSAEGSRRQHRVSTVIKKVTSLVLITRSHKEKTPEASAQGWKSFKDGREEADLAPLRVPDRLCDLPMCFAHRCVAACPVADKRAAPSQATCMLCTPASLAPSCFWLAAIANAGQGMATPPPGGPPRIEAPIAPAPEEACRAPRGGGPCRDFGREKLREKVRGNRRQECRWPSHADDAG